MSKQPFLTVVTRCYKRPEALKLNIQSLKQQTEPDYEQIFIVDKVGHGLAAADQALNKYREYNLGQYVMVLDDDDYVIDPNFIFTLKETATEHDPDVIIWRGFFNHLQKVLPPKNNNWGKRVVKCKIGSFNYAIKNELYNKYVYICASGKTGDFDFINSILRTNPSTYWLDNIMVQATHSNAGTQEKAVNSIANGKRLIRKHPNRARV